MSSVYPKGSVLYFRVKVDGKWIGVPTDFKVGQEKEAKKLLAKLDARQAAGEALDDGHLGPVTVRRVEKKWIAAREREVPSWKNDESVMRLHVLPVLGDKLIDEVTAADVLSLVKGWRARTLATAEKLAEFRKFAEDGLVDRSAIVAGEDAAVLALCLQHGYGAVMDSAARQWRARDPVGAFTTGHCVGTLQHALGLKVGGR